MPQVPRYNQQVVKEQGMPGVRLNPSVPIEAFGGGRSAEQVGTAISGLNQTAVKLAQEASEQANQARLLEERREINQWEYANIYDPKTGAINKVGKDAFGIHESLSADYDKFIAEREKGLGNEDQRLAFRQLAESRRDHMMRWAQGHVGTQMKVVEEAEYGASLESSKERASVDPRNVAIEGAFIQQQTMLRAQKLGWDAEQTKQELQKHESDMHSRVVNSMLAKNQDMAASDYFKKIKDRIDPDVATKLTGVLEEGSLRGESQRKSDAIIREYGDLEAAREAVRQIQDPKLRDAVDDRVKMEFSIRDRQEGMAREKNFMGAADILEKSKSIDAIPPAQWRALLPGQRDALRSLQKQLLTGEVKHDDAVYLKYLGMSESQLAKVSEAELIEKVRPNVKEGYYKEIAHRWAAVKDALNNPKKSAEVKSMFTDEEMVMNAMKAGKIGGVGDNDSPAKLTGEKATAYRQMREKVDQAWQAHFHETGKMPNAEQKKKIVDDMVVRKVFVDKNWLWSDPEKPVSLLSEDERGLAYVPMDKIPTSDRNAIENVLKSKGKRITQKKLERAYGAYLIGDKKMFESILGE